MTIYDSTGAVVYEAPITTSAIIKRVLMGDYYIELTFDVVERIDVGRGCYILYDGHKFEIMTNVLPDDTNTGGLRYTLKFEAQQSQMKRCKVFWRDSSSLEVSFSNTTSLSSFGKLIVDNVNAFLGSNNWSLGSISDDKSLKTVSFNGDTCWDAVATIAETFGVEWWTEESGDNVSLCFGKLEYGSEVEFRRGDVVSSIPSKRGDNANYGTRFYVFGSTKNLPSDYLSTSEGGIVNHIVEKRLHLPDGIDYIDAWENLAQEDVVEQVVFFDDIFPTNVDTVTSVDKEAETVIEGRYDFVYTLYCADTPFTPDNIIDGEQMQINFTSGDLMGQTFDVEINADSFDKKFRIVPNVYDAENGILLPNDNYYPKPGDTFILLGIELPKSRVTDAENLLLETGQEYAQKNSNDTEVYDCPTNAVYCHKNSCNYDLGQKVLLLGDKFGTGRSSRIQGYEKKLYDEYQAVYTVGDNSAYSRLADVEKSIRYNAYSDRVGLDANIIRSKSDSTIPSDYNVYSALATLEYFLHKNRGGIVKGHTNFAKGLSMYGKEIKYDVEKNVFVFPFNVLVEGGVAWNTKLEGFEEQTITAAVQVDWKTIGKNEAGELYVIDYTGGGSGGGSGSGGVVGGVTIDEVKNYLTNEGYATQVWVNEQGFLKSITSAMVTSTLGYTPFNTANFTKNNIKTTLGISDWALEGVKPSYEFSEITNKPTTLGGYGITNAYTQSQVDSALAKKWTQDDSLIANWNSAYFWGNHASAGYAKQSDITSEFSKYVTISTAQTVTGIKDFANGLKVGGVLVSYNADKNAFVLPANLLVEGGVAWNSKIDGFDVPTIMDAIQVDGDTISKDKGYLEFVGQTSGGGTADSVAWENVTGRPTKLSQFTNDSGFITDVTSALGYTPFNAANFTKSNIQTTLGISNWALASSSPFRNGTTQVTASVDIDALTTGIDFTQNYAPVDGAYNYGQMLTLRGDTNGFTQFYIPDNSAHVYIRNRWNLSQIASATWREILTSYSCSDYAVTLDSTAQNITGIKNFVNGLKIGGTSVTYNASKNAFVFPANAIFEGGIAWNSKLDGFSVPTIMDAIQVDGHSISKANGYLEFIGETGGLDETELAEYLTNNNYAKKSDIPSLSGYATQAWVTSKGYITGITSSMVTTALGYTPYNAANFTKANIKSTLGISDWALASAKPTYTASEVGALGVDDTAQAAKRIVPDNSSINATTWNGVAGLSVGEWNSNGAGFSNTYGTTINFQGISTWYHRLAFATDGVIEHWMGINTTTMSKVGRIAYMGSIPTNLSQFTDDVVKGNYLAQDSSSTNADLDTILENKTAVLKPFFQSFASNDIGSARKGVLRMTYNGSESQLLFDHYNRLLRYRTIGANPKDWATIAFTSDIPTKLSQLTDDVVNGNYLSTLGGTVSGNITATKFVGALEGNADSATKLASSRKIWGQYFNGTGDVNGLFKAYGEYGGYSMYAGSRENEALSIEIITSSGGWLGRGIMLALNGNVAIGGTTADERLHVYGNTKVTGNVSAQNVVANSGITAGSIISFVDTDASKKIVLQRNSSGDILFCGDFADRNVYIDGSILRVRTENTIFSRGISTTGVTLRSGDKSAVISYNASKNAFVFPANAIFEGGVAWNSPMDGTSAYASELERRIEALQTEVDTLKQTVQTLTA